MVRTSKRKRDFQARSIYLWIGDGDDYNYCAANVRGLALMKGGGQDEDQKGRPRSASG